MGVQRVQTWARAATILAAAVAAAVAFLAAVEAQQFPLAVVVLSALLVRLQAPSEQWRDVGAVGLVMAIAGTIGVVDGLSGPLAITLLLVIADYGFRRAVRSVVAVGVGAAALAVVTAAAAGSVDIADPRWIWFLAVVPLFGLVAARLGGDPSEVTAAMESATAALDEVLALAERIPAGFDRWSVATAVHLELLEASRLGQRQGPTPHLLLVQQGVLFGVGSPIARKAVGLLADLPQQPRFRVWAKARPADLPAPLNGRLDDTRWYVHRLGGEDTSGVVLVPHDIQPAALKAVNGVLRPASVALANVQRFERLEDVAISAARTRVAHDLHDGVAQALTHVRFELDLLALEHEDLVADISRIRRVADSALLEVRRTVGELRDAAPLANRITSHVELLRSFAPATVQLELPDTLDVPDDLADDIFRIVQEALTNAVRHAGASTIRVSVHEDNAGLSVAVVDDGVGIGARVHPGVGLGGMESRARRLGGDLGIRPRRGGGTVVELDVPLHRPVAAAEPRGGVAARSSP